MSSSLYLGVFIIYYCVSYSYYESYIIKSDSSNYIQMNLIETAKIETEKDISFQVPDENWIVTALKDIAYFLRNSKFNDWDRRYYREMPPNNLIGFYKAFPKPPLKLLHWKVFENCYKNFYKCIIYLHSIIDTVPFRRTDDIITKLQTHLIPKNDSTITKLNNECKDALLYSDKTAVPFDGPKEKFQWRISASYFMCWYTMLETQALSMLGDQCANFANCLDQMNGTSNRDPRADDRQSFVCAMFSFCPDPCCPLKYVENVTQCQEFNPCHFCHRNNANRSCKFDRKHNQNFEGIVKNNWNISCFSCDAGFEWKSKFGICVDINECINGNNTCNNGTEVCLNLPGTFHCVCRFNLYFNNKTKSCNKITYSSRDLH